jgi:hypothetical protein
MKCPKCGNESGGKFCGKCGSPIQPSRAGADPSAKFIDPVTVGAAALGAVVGGAATAAASAFGTKPPPSDPVAVEGVVLLDKSAIQLTLVPGVVARKLTEKEMQDYATRDGVVVSPGTTLMVIADGSMAATLAGGYYELPKNRGSNASLIGGGAGRGFIDGIISWIRGKKDDNKTPVIPEQGAEKIRRAKHVSLVLFREAPFNLPFNFEELPFADGVRSSAAVVLRCEVKNPQQLFVQVLADRPRVDESQVAEAIKPVLQMELSKILPSFRPEDFTPGPELFQELPQRLKEVLATSFPGIAVVALISASANGAEVEQIRVAGQQLYFDGRKIDQMERMNLLENRLASVENRRKLDQATSDHELSAALDAVNRDNLLTEEEMTGFKAELERRRMLREEETDNLGRDITDRTTDRLLARTHALDLLRIERQLEADVSRYSGEAERQKHEAQIRRSELEAQLGLKGIELQLRSAEDGYDDERRNKDLEFKAKDRSQRLQQMADLVGLREQRENARHEREMAAKQQELQHDINRTSMYAGMSFEQIMATNPNISPEAAKALAEKFKGDKDRELLDKRDEDKASEMKRMQDMMDRMQQMAETTMKQTAAIAAGQVASAKNAGEDLLSAVESTLKASGQVFSADARAKGPKQQQNTGKPAKIRYCKSCEAELDSDSAFCPECGEKVE